MHGTRSQMRKKGKEEVDGNLSLIQTPEKLELSSTKLDDQCKTTRSMQMIREGKEETDGNGSLRLIQTPKELELSSSKPDDRRQTTRSIQMKRKGKEEADGNLSSAHTPEKLGIHVSPKPDDQRQTTRSMQTRSFAIDKNKAIEKKLDACDIPPIQIESKDGNKQTVIKCNTGSYEVIKKTVINYFQHETSKLATGMITDVFDQQKAKIGETIKIVNRKKNGEAGNITKYVVNMYHTTNTILINDKAHDNFIKDDLPHIVSTLKKKLPIATYLNTLLREALEKCRKSGADSLRKKGKQGGKRKDSWYHFTCEGIDDEHITVSQYVCVTCNQREDTMCAQQDVADGNNAGDSNVNSSIEDVQSDKSEDKGVCDNVPSTCTNINQGAHFGGDPSVNRSKAQGACFQDTLPSMTSKAQDATATNKVQGSYPNNKAPVSSREAQGARLKDNAPPTIDIPDFSPLKLNTEPNCYAKGKPKRGRPAGNKSENDASSPRLILKLENEIKELKERNQVSQRYIKRLETQLSESEKSNQLLRIQAANKTSLQADSSPTMQQAPPIQSGLDLKACVNAAEIVVIKHRLSLMEQRLSSLGTPFPWMPPPFMSPWFNAMPPPSFVPQGNFQHSQGNVHHPRQRENQSENVQQQNYHPLNRNMKSPTLGKNVQPGNLQVSAQQTSQKDHSSPMPPPNSVPQRSSQHSKQREVQLENRQQQFSHQSNGRIDSPTTEDKIDQAIKVQRNAHQTI